MRVLLFLLLIAATGAFAQDYEREKRWAAEVTPNLVVGDAVELKLPSGREFLGLYAASQAAPNAILLVHGLGVHPDHGVIGSLRSLLSDKGYTTLSIQMPVLSAETGADGYPAVFPEAAARIQAAIGWLAAKGYRRPVLLSHSMGSRMANAYVEQVASTPIAAWISLGITTEYAGFGDFRGPVLDVYGENDFPAVLQANAGRLRRIIRLPGSVQAKIPLADHYYTGRENELAAAIRDFLVRLK